MEPTQTPTVDVEDLPGGIRVLTLNNPAKKNALTPGMLVALGRAIELTSTRQVRVLVIQGKQNVFCAGYDLDSLGEPEGSALPDDGLTDLLQSLERHPAPAIALVEGPAFGAGCELAAACDVRVAAEDAVFCMPPAKLGIVYSEEGLWRVARLCGTAFARRMFYTAERVTALRALQTGLVEQVEPKATAQAKALELAGRIAEGAPLAVQGMKRSFFRITELRLPAEAREELRRLRATAFASEDVREGRAAFREKRPPVFKGR